MDIEELLTKPISELTQDEIKQCVEFMKGMYQDLLQIVSGHTKKEKDEIILSLTFAEKVTLVKGYRDGRK